MRYALALICLLATPAAALADPAEDFVSCVIGRAAVALINGAEKQKALEAGYDLCRFPAGDDVDIDTLGNTINLMVERMAAD